jgi:6-phosphofructokinase 2
MATRIITLTLNPAVDLACEADAVIHTRKMRTSSEQFDPGGGGINVARVVRELGGEALAVLLIGGGTGRFLQELLEEARVECLNIPVEGRTRISVTVHERSTGLEYRMVPEGPPISASEWDAVLDALARVEGGWLVASGSLPRGAPEDAYAQIARLCARRGQHFVLDTSGPPLRAALGEGATLIKPSLSEFAGLVGRVVTDPHEQEREAMKLVRGGAAQMIAISLGSVGAILAHASGVIRMDAPQVPVRSAVGAGDSFVAAMTFGLACGLTPEQAFARGIAAGSAAVMRYGTAHPQREDVEQFYREMMAR